MAVNSVADADTTKAVIPANADGTFEIDLPAGDYLLSYFDISKFYLLQSVSFVVAAFIQ